MKDIASGLLMGFSVTCFALAGYAFRLWKESKYISGGQDSAESPTKMQT